jgi:hypothetical protein
LAALPGLAAAFVRAAGFAGGFTADFAAGFAAALAAAFAAGAFTAALVLRAGASSTFVLAMPDSIVKQAK